MTLALIILLVVFAVSALIVKPYSDKALFEAKRLTWRPLVDETFAIMMVVLIAIYGVLLYLAW